MENGAPYDRKGYLNGDFRLFHLRDSEGPEINYHYHDFDKIVVFISGRVDYMVEGVVYPLAPMDVLLVGHHRLHKAEIDGAEPYERVIIYVDAGFAERSGTEKTSLSECFRIAERNGFCLLRPDKRNASLLGEHISRLETAAASDGFGSDVLARAAFLQTMVFINRLALAAPGAALRKSVKYDPRISETLSYISANLTADLSVDALAARCYFSRYHFMRLFHELTGSTVHSYIRRKRLLCAATLIKNGMPTSRAAAASGFGDYSAFVRAFKSEFGAPPSAFTETGISGTPESE